MRDLIQGNIVVKEEERTPCEVWTRVMGYHRPTSEFNEGKKSEHRERRHFREGCIDSGHCFPRAAIAAS